MKNKKFVTIDIDGEENVGVINLGDITDVHVDNVKSHFTDNVEPSILDALRSHFDCPAKIRVPANIKTFHPITIEYVVLLEQEEEDTEIVVTLNETWIY